MLRIRLSKLTSVLSDVNCVIGGLSVLAVFTGSLAAIIGVGGYSLEKVGLLKEEDTWEQVWAFAIISSTAGLAGSSVAATSGAFLNHLSEKIDKENNLFLARNGSPIWINNPACPQQLKNDYNLPLLLLTLPTNWNTHGSSGNRVGNNLTF